MRSREIRESKSERKKKKRRTRRGIPDTLAAIPSYRLCNIRTLYLATDNDNDISSRQDQRPCPCSCPYPSHIIIITTCKHHHSTATKTIQNNNKPADYTTLHTTNRPATPACISWFPTVSWSGSPSPNPKRPRASRYSSKGSSDPCAADWPLPCVSLIFSLSSYISKNQPSFLPSTVLVLQKSGLVTCLKAGLWPLRRNKGALAELKVF